MFFPRQAARARMRQIQFILIKSPPAPRITSRARIYLAMPASVAPEFPYKLREGVGITHRWIAVAACVKEALFHPNIYTYNKLTRFRSLSLSFCRSPNWFRGAVALGCATANHSRTLCGAVRADVIWVNVFFGSTALRTHSTTYTYTHTHI